MKKNNSVIKSSLLSSHAPLGRQRGALMIVTLIILLIVSMLGMSTMDTTGLEMKMSSNSRSQQMAFEAAEYTLSWVENNLASSGYFSDNSLQGSNCGQVCFDSTCTNGFCFSGVNPEDWANCESNVSATEYYESAALWADGSDKYQTLAVPNMGITTQYIIEYRCYTAKDNTFPMDLGNNARMYRITVYSVAQDGRARVMLRSTIKEV